jgi:hypothetical protein
MANTDQVDFNIRELRNLLNLALAGDDAALAYILGVDSYSGTFTRRQVGRTRQLQIPLTAFVDADGDPIAKFADASQPTYGFTLVNSEAMAIRWNNDATPGTMLTSVALPPDLDADENMTVNFLCSKTGATDADDTTFTVAAYIIASGDLHDADANCGGTTSALDGDATAKTTATISLTITAANIPASAKLLNLAIAPTAGTLGTDDLLLHAVWLSYTSKEDTAS